jgi:hypothetical protein
VRAGWCEDAEWYEGGENKSWPNEKALRPRVSLSVTGTIFSHEQCQIDVEKDTSLQLSVCKYREIGVEVISTGSTDRRSSHSASSV